MRTRLIFNPVAHRGRVRKSLPQVVDRLQALGVPFDMKPTEAPGQGITLALEAALRGYDRVVAVGGDGTCNEVVNGLLMASEQGFPAMLGVIPLGSGNDLACSLQIPLKLEAACQVLKDGAERVIDAAQITVEGYSRYFANSVGLGLEAEVTIRSRQVKYLHGFPMYLWSALNVIAAGRWPYQAQLSFGGQMQQQSLTLMAVCNGVRSGGGFYLTPNAKMDDGLFDVCYGPAVSRLTLLNLLPRALKGNHLDHAAVSLVQAAKVELTVESGIPAHVDGEVFCTAGRQLSFELLPGALRVWGGA